MKLTKSNIKRKIWRDNVARTLRKARKDPHQKIIDLLNDWRRDRPELQKLKADIQGLYCTRGKIYIERELWGTGIHAKASGDGLMWECGQRLI